MQEKWIKWDPILGVSNKYYVESISDNIKDGLRILLIDYDDSEKKILMSWPNSVDAYRSTYESFTLLTLNKINEDYGKGFCDWTFFKIENSKYLKWISEQSYGTTDSLDFIHFCIYATESLVDIVTNYEPTVTLIEK